MRGSTVSLSSMNHCHDLGLGKTRQTFLCDASPGTHKALHNSVYHKSLFIAQGLLGSVV